MRFIAIIKEHPKSKDFLGRECAGKLACNQVFTASRITQQGVHAGDNFFNKDDFTFEKTMPFSVPTGADIEALECKVRRCTATDDELELWGLVK